MVRVNLCVDRDGSVTTEARDFPTEVGAWAWLDAELDKTRRGQGTLYWYEVVPCPPEATPCPSS